MIMLKYIILRPSKTTANLVSLHIPMHTSLMSKDYVVNTNVHSENDRALGGSKYRLPKNICNKCMYNIYICTQPQHLSACPVSPNILTSTLIN